MYDKKNLGKLEKFGQLCPDQMKAFMAFDNACMEEGTLSVKVKELIALGVAMTTQCPYCIGIHTDKATQAGATEKEMAEAVFVAAALRAGGAMTHGTHCLK
ncbi:MAG: carboxymuconolactone decarboxylase family protein [Acidobacteria bacterium]|nr:carboxymuconolactone decarboxylase family protein [Acidobacteriota bacterium]